VTARLDRDAAGNGARTDQGWTVLRLILWSADYLGEKGVENGRLDAEHLLAKAVGVDRLQLYLDYDRPLAEAELEDFRPLLKRRAKREPLQYILARQAFRELQLEVSREVLIPRPETELLVGEVLEWVSKQEREAPTALDVGTGSGAISLSLAFEGPFASVVATDVAEGALELARRNRDAAGLGHAVELRLGSLFDPIGPQERFDVIVSNPPYVPEADAASLQPEVTEWEPHGALFGGPDGLDVLRGLAGGARRHLHPGGLLGLEVGAGQAAKVVELIEEEGGYREVRVARDYSGRERFVLAREATVE